MFDRDCGQHRVHHERTGRLTAGDQTAQDLEMPLAWLDGGNVGLFQPRADGGMRFGLTVKRPVRDSV